MVSCAECRLFACLSGNVEKMPAGCPMEILGEVIEKAKLEYDNQEV